MSNPPILSKLTDALEVLVTESQGAISHGTCRHISCSMPSRHADLLPRHIQVHQGQPSAIDFLWSVHRNEPVLYRGAFPSSGGSSASLDGSEWVLALQVLPETGLQ